MADGKHRPFARRIRVVAVLCSLAVVVMVAASLIRSFDWSRSPEVTSLHRQRMRMAVNRVVAHVIPAYGFVQSAAGVIRWRLMRTDTHWSQEGAELAAEMIASRVTVPIDRSHTYQTNEASMPTLAGGNLIRVMCVADLPDTLPIKLRPRAEYEHVAHTVELNPQDDHGDLLGDGPSVDVALVGTSFSLTSNFLGYLKAALHAPVLNMAVDGGAFDTSAARYFRGVTFAEAKPALVIWEIPEQNVSQALEGDFEALAVWAR